MRFVSLLGESFLTNRNPARGPYLLTLGDEYRGF